MFKIDIKFIIVVLLGIFAIIGVFILKIFTQAELDSLMSSAQVSLSRETKLEVAATTALLIVDNGETQEQIELEIEEPATAFDLLKHGAAKLDLELKTKKYDMGIFIEQIGEKENGQDNKYWLYYVNGEMPMTSADKQEIKAGDKIEFKFEKSLF